MQLALFEFELINMYKIKRVPWVQTQACTEQRYMYKRRLRGCCAVMLFNNALFELLKTLLSNQDRLGTSSFGKVIDFFNSGMYVLLGLAFSLILPIDMRGR